MCPPSLQGGVRKWLMRLNFTKWQAWLKEVWRKVRRKEPA